MTATELAALIVAIASVVAAVLLAFALVALTNTLKEVRTAVELLRSEAVPVVVELGHTVRSANAELERVDDLLGSAKAISGTVDSASRLAYLALSNPVIKAMALASGTSRAASAFRRSRER